MRHEHLEALGPPGIYLDLQRSLDLQNWQIVDGAVQGGAPDAQGHLTLEFDSLDHAGSTNRLFYRLVVP